MKKSRFIALTLAVLALASCKSASTKVEATVPAKIVDGTIVLQTPAREKGQESALQMACDPIDTVRVGFIGLGMRGADAVHRYTFVEGVKITAICDRHEDRVKSVQGMLAGRGFPAAKEYSGEEGWKQLCESDDVDLVYICTDWLHHTPMAVYAMEHGKHAACEVPSAMSVDECWQLVNTCEKTRKHFMMLENCCYDFYEMTALNMAQQGVFGEVYHVEGAYIHNLNPFWKEYDANWRLDYNYRHRGDNYPTHGIGPICQVLNIHRGDKMNTLVAMDTESYVGKAIAKEQMGVDEFADGDHTVTLIRTEKGHQIEIQHNVYAARPYSRMYSLTGTKGYATKYPQPNLTVPEYHDGESFVPREMYDSLMNAYKPELIKDIEAKAREVGGHGGMDYIMDYRLIYCLRNGLPLDEDVYDAAEWCCLTELSRLSIENGCMPVQVPDFTRGDWDKVKGFSYAVK